MLADKLAGYTEKCTISFIDLYRNTQRNISPLNIQVPTEIQIEQLVTQFSEIAAQYGIYIDTCAEKIDLDKFGIKHAHCIDKDRLERIGQYTLDIDKDKNQRTECGCFASIDIGTYNTCKMAACIVMPISVKRQYAITLDSTIQHLRYYLVQLETMML